jgi:hypothetical protein
MTLARADFLHCTGSLIMNARIALLGFALLAGTATAAMADEGGARHQGMHRPQSYTEDTTRTFADGRSFKRHVEQKAADGRVTRQITEIAPDGKTASRTVVRSIDKDRHTWSRTVQGTRFDGKTYSSTAQGEGMPEGHRHHGGHNES